MKVTPDIRAFKPVPGNRYMINPKTAGKFGAPIFSYNAIMMEQNKDLVEWFPNYVKSETKSEEPKVVSGSTEEPIEIEDVPIAIDAKSPEPDATVTPEPSKKLTPVEAMRLGREAKAAERKKKDNV